MTGIEEKQEMFVKKLRQYLFIKWLVAAIASVIVVVFFATGGFSTTVFISSLSLICLSAVSGLFLLWKIKAKRNLGLLANISLSSDLIYIIGALYVSGGIENTWLFFPVFIIITASYLFSMKISMRYATFAFFCVLIMVLLEYNRVIPHYSVYGFPDDFFRQFPNYWKDKVAGVFLLYFVSSYTTGLFTKIINASSAKLEKNNIKLGKEIGERKKAEIRLKKQKEKLEDTVTERTDELKKKNEMLTRENARRKRIENKLVESKEKYRILVENANEAILVVQDKMLKFVNSKTFQVTGYSENEMLSKLFIEFIHPLDRKLVMTNHLARLEGKYVPPIYTFRIQSKQGNIMWVEMNAVVISWEGRPATLAFLNDVTEKTKIEKQLLQTQKLESLGIVAGGIAHDFNNILMGVLGNVTLAKMHMKPDDRIYAILTEAESASLRARELTQQLLTFSKGGMPVRKMVSIGSAIKETIHFSLKDSKQRFEYSIPVDLWNVNADTGQISQVIQNLVINASQATSESGVIVVKAENVYVDDRNALPLKEGKYVKVSIEDHGAGISTEYLNKIFDPYFTTKQNGSGLGLSVCYSIIKNHDGYIVVNSKKGIGTTFVFYLPAIGESIKNGDIEKQRMI